MLLMRSAEDDAESWSCPLLRMKDGAQRLGVLQTGRLCSTGNVPLASLPAHPPTYCVCTIQFDDMTFEIRLRTCSARTDDENDMVADTNIPPIIMFMSRLIVSTLRRGHAVRRRLSAYPSRNPEAPTHTMLIDDTHSSFSPHLALHIGRGIVA